jgi:hypothetical protein
LLPAARSRQPTSAGTYPTPRSGTNPVALAQLDIEDGTVATGTLGLALDGVLFGSANLRSAGPTTSVQGKFDLKKASAGCRGAAKACSAFFGKFGPPNPLGALDSLFRKKK